MNVFVLSTGRCGSVTFWKACRHITNFSSAHESLMAEIEGDRFAYPANHIESDNRLSWLLGRLENTYGADAYYVHLTRDPEATARSWVKRYNNPDSMIFGYRKIILQFLPEDKDPMAVALDYVDTVTTNIQQFLKDKPHRMDFRLEHAEADFRKFWEWIGAEGDLEAALGEFKIAHNAHQTLSPGAAAVEKMKRVVKKLPAFLRDA